MMLKNDILKTPPYIYESLGHFDLDPCAGTDTNIADYNWNDGGLEKEWFGFIFCNPPFSQKEIWIKHMIDHNNGILLLPERGSAPWFGPLAETCGRYFVMGKKINFIGGSSTNNVGSVLFLFGEEALKRVINSNLPGHLVNVLYYKNRNK